MSSTRVSSRVVPAQRERERERERVRQRDRERVRDREVLAQGLGWL